MIQYVFLVTKSLMHMFGVTLWCVLGLGACSLQVPSAQGFIFSCESEGSSDSGCSSDSGEGDSGRIDTFDDDSAPTGGDSPEPSTPIFSGKGFVDAFFTESGLYLVHTEGVQLIDSRGEPMRVYKSHEAIKSAASDGEWLGVAGEAMLVTLDSELRPNIEIPLAEECRSAIMVSGPRFVCGFESAGEYAFYTYDALNGILLGVSESLSSGAGTPMRRVPGTDDFVVVSIGSDFFLYDAASDSVQFVGGSSYVARSAGLVLGFIGWPATHLVDPKGVMHEIRAGPRCAVGERLSMNSECFIVSGELGALPDEMFRYGDLREAADGYLYGLVSGPLCDPESCKIHRIHPSSRRVVSIAPLTLAENRDFSFLYLRPRPQNDSVAVIAGWNAPFSEHSHVGRAEFYVYYVVM